MPISKHDFEVGLTDEMREWIHAIHGFLGAKGHREQAYSEAELMEVVEIVKDNVPITLVGHDPETGRETRLLEPHYPVRGLNRKPVFTAALQHLARTGAVERKLMGGTHYLRYRGDLPPLD